MALVFPDKLRCSPFLPGCLHKPASLSYNLKWNQLKSCWKWFRERSLGANGCFFFFPHLWNASNCWPFIFPSPSWLYFINVVINFHQLLIAGWLRQSFWNPVVCQRRRTEFFLILFNLILCLLSLLLLWSSERLNAIPVLILFNVVPEIIWSNEEAKMLMEELNEDYMKVEIHIEKDYVQFTHLYFQSICFSFSLSSHKLSWMWHYVSLWCHMMKSLNTARLDWHFNSSSLSSSK